MRKIRKKLIISVSCMFISGLLNSTLLAQQQVDFTAPTPPDGLVIPPLPDGPLFYDTAEGHDIRVVVVARGLNHPWSIAFLPDGAVLVSEKNAGHLRVIRNDVLDPHPVAGIPEVVVNQFSGLLDVVLHPQFQDNQYIYLSYNKPLENGTAVAIARGHWDGQALQETKDIFIADTGTIAGSRLAFGVDGSLYVSIFGAFGNVAQETNTHAGKVLRLTDEGGVPKDNPFVGIAGHKPEIYSIGHRSILGLALHTASGDMWELEMGPNGGDEVNILKAGANYGWPLVNLGRDYAGPWQSETFNLEGMEDPVIYWMPSISVSGMAFYTGDKFPKWKGNLFVGGMRTGEIPGTGRMQRFLFNEKMEELRRETLLADLRQRIRDVRQSPDGYIYVVTDEDDGAVLRIEPK